jgi:cysteine synthase
VKELLLPVIQNLLKDLDSLDPAHKEALELIVKERSSGRLDMITKAMGTHLSFTGVSNLFSENVFHAKKETLDTVGETQTPSPPQAPVQEETRLFNRFMRGNFGDMIRGKNQNQ